MAVTLSGSETSARRPGTSISNAPLSDRRSWPVPCAVYSAKPKLLEGRLTRSIHGARALVAAASGVLWLLMHVGYTGLLLCTTRSHASQPAQWTHRP